jgi:hypothetical protein
VALDAGNNSLFLVGLGSGRRSALLLFDDADIAGIQPAHDVMNSGQAVAPNIT